MGYKALNKNGKELHSTVSLHPGEVLDMELEARDIKKSEFAKQLGVQAAHLSDLIHAKRHVSAATAIKLEKLLNISAEYWMRIQMYYDLQMEREKLKSAA